MISNLEKLVQYVGGVILMNFIWPQMCKKVWTSLSQNDWIILVVCVFVNNACKLTLKNEWSFGCGFGIYFLKHLFYKVSILYALNNKIVYIVNIFNLFLDLTRLFTSSGKSSNKYLFHQVNTAKLKAAL